jgi:hypothetical protein
LEKKNLIKERKEWEAEKKGEKIVSEKKGRYGKG